MEFCNLKLVFSVKIFFPMTHGRTLLSLGEVFYSTIFFPCSLYATANPLRRHGPYHLPTRFSVSVLNPSGALMKGRPPLKAAAAVPLSHVPYLKLHKGVLLRGSTSLIKHIYHIYCISIAYKSSTLGYIHCTSKGTHVG